MRVHSYVALLPAQIYTKSTSQAKDLKRRLQTPSRRRTPTRCAYLAVVLQQTWMRVYLAAVLQQTWDLFVL
eukprot:12503742-Alexandrium_andersonii.AAC.1